MRSIHEGEKPWVQLAFPFLHPKYRVCFEEFVSTVRSLLSPKEKIEQNRIVTLPFSLYIYIYIHTQFEPLDLMG